jgi:hypothetical protein
MHLSIVGLPRRSEADGSLVLLAKEDDAQEVHHVTVPAKLVATLILQFQQSVLEGAKEGTFYPLYPEMTVTDANLAHQPEASELMVSIDQMGWMVIRCSDEILRHLKTLIDRVMMFRSQGPSSH